MANPETTDNLEINQKDITILLSTVNISIERQIEQIKKEVDMFTDFLAELKK